MGEVSSTPCLSVVIVSFNTRERLRECLGSVVAQAAHAVVVADNGSSDGSIEMVHREFPRVIVDVDERNPGYGAAANRGIRRCGGTDVLLLNSDTRLYPGALASLVAYLTQHPEAGIVGPRLLNSDGSLQPSCFPFPSPLRPPLQGDPIGRLLGLVPGGRERSLATWSHDRPRRVPWVMGAALTIRRQTFDDLDGFDESFFMYAEEIDFCYRARQRGWETHFAPVARVEHEGRCSTGQYRTAMLAQGCASAMRFYQRHYSGRSLLQAASTMAAAMVWRILRDRLRRAVTRDPVRRAELDEDVGVWQSALVRSIRAGCHPCTRRPV